MLVLSTLESCREDPIGKHWQLQREREWSRSHWFLVGSCPRPHFLFLFYPKKKIKLGVCFYFCKFWNPTKGQRQVSKGQIFWPWDWVSKSDNNNYLQNPKQKTQHSFSCKKKGVCVLLLRRADNDLLRAETQTCAVCVYASSLIYQGHGYVLRKKRERNMFWERDWTPFWFLISCSFSFSFTHTHISTFVNKVFDLLPPWGLTVSQISFIENWGEHVEDSKLFFSSFFLYMLYHHCFWHSVLLSAFLISLCVCVSSFLKDGLKLCLHGC